MPHWLSDSRAVADWFARQRDASILAVDTEFVRERTFHAQLALVQCSVDGDDIALIDPLSDADPAPLLARLADPVIEKVMHSASEDLQVLSHRFGTIAAPLFDTQIAAALAGLGGGMSYQRLVAAVSGRELEKGETRSDWTRRPLSQAQQRYAADDVRDLPALHAHLSAKLDALGRRDWLREDCARLVASATDPLPDPHPHLAVRSAQRMRRESQARLRRVLRWRDERARASDRPRTWIIDNELAVILADRPPTTRAGFDALLDERPRSPRRDRDRVWELASTPLRGDELDIPLATLPDPDLRRRLVPLQAKVAEVAAALDIPDALLCARRHLEALAGGEGWPQPLQGWRREVLEPALAPLLPAPVEG